MLLRWIEFFEYLKNVRGRSLNTIMAYRRDLELYQEYSCGALKNISGFYDFMKRKNLSLRSQARVISSLRTYFRFCESLGDESSELRDLKLPQVKVSLPINLAFEDFHKLYLASTDVHPMKMIRNQICLLLLYSLGCRVSELINLSIKDLNRDQGVLLIHGKKGKIRSIQLADHLLNNVNIYIEKVRSFLNSSGTSSLLINDRGKRPSRVDIWRWLAAWSARAGFKEPIHPHRFRHGCATALLQAGTDLKSVQMILGHANIKTTQIYTIVAKI